MGGLKEKILTVHRAGIKSMLLPQRNEQELVDIPRRVKRHLNLILVKSMDQVLEHALLEEKD